MKIEPEAPNHHSSVRKLLVAAFPSSAEADLVDQLRRDDDATISLVAPENGRVIGHVMFSRMDAPFPSLGLAPVAVPPGRRRQGVAAALIKEGLRRAKAQGWEAVFVVGDPAYYQRFGFRADEAVAFVSPYAGPNLMVLSLAEAGLPIRTGRIDYAPAFSAVG
jgi:putative acetyltransferase